MLESKSSTEENVLETKPEIFWLEANGVQISHLHWFPFFFLFQLREATSRVEELETANKHLETRLGKLKTAKSALLKELW